ncbi:aspartate--tRNA ligase 1, cytoplasmic-like [Panicum virgatum]|uniref:Uncharacterized protein n=1 Tax=Panicum virgatum TaxID=38727 RepID=A0A8T0VTP4_PANVG|nr:aspartate--tRNA ligase 1, cytoplasmic-like [Panicum virgatum]KAG2634889.1 hypothetical protein PVAP13_2NG324306 [Panicum virgatum]KAG2634891.1 hypothetical protein PVAP13_2NG324306 [Panicum virgatum]
MLHRASRSASLDDATAAAEAVELEGHGAGRPRVDQDTRLNYRALELRTPANQALIRILCQVENRIDITEIRNHPCFRENHPADLMEQWTTTQCVTGII